MITLTASLQDDADGTAGGATRQNGTGSPSAGWMGFVSVDNPGLVHPHLLRVQILSGLWIECSLSSPNIASQPSPSFSRPCSSLTGHRSTCETLTPAPAYCAVGHDASYCRNLSNKHIPSRTESTSIHFPLIIAVCQLLLIFSPFWAPVHDFTVDF